MSPFQSFLVSSIDSYLIPAVIINLLNDKNRYKELISLGSKRVLAFPNYRERAKQYLNTCHNQIIK